VFELKLVEFVTMAMEAEEICFKSQSVEARHKKFRGDVRESKYQIYVM